MSLDNRLEFILHGRFKHAWGKQIGINKGIIDAIWNGKMPGAEKLIPAIKAENLSLSWLLEGVGTPYRVSYCTSDDDCYELLKTLYEERWLTTIISDKYSIAVLLRQEGTYMVNEKHYEYTISEVVIAPVGKKSLALISELNDDFNTNFLVVSVAKMRDLAKGLIGTFKLFLSSDALFTGAKPVLQGTMPSLTAGISEEQSTYTVDDALNSIVGDLRKLNSDQRDAIEAVIHSMAVKSDKPNND